jgi:MtN3 and saliva related transmembrane protein
VILPVSSDLVQAIGSLAGACTTIAYLPQVHQALKTRSVKDVSLGMYALMSLGIGLWIVYGILIESWPIIVANAIAVALTATIMVLHVRYAGHMDLIE